MCNYTNFENGTCNVTKEVCPYLYFCNKIKKYKATNSIPTHCKIKETRETPKGFYKVSFERRNFLYIDVDGKIEVVENPYDYVPTYIKMSKLKSGAWKIREAK